MRNGRAATTWRRGAVAALALLLPAGSLAGTPSAGATAPQAPRAAASCSAENRISHTLPNGTTWKMCYRNDKIAGLVLTDVSYRPKHADAPIKVLANARLGQIHVPYDDGAVEYNDLTEIALGSSPESLKAKDCPGGTRRPVRLSGRTYQAVCVTQQPRGFAHYGFSGDVGEPDGKTDSAQGQDLVVYTVHSAGYYLYVTQWNFSDDGTITAKEGATGNLAPGDFDASDDQGWPIGEGATDRATSHQHNVFWRLDFRTDSSRRPRVEQYDTRRTGSNDGIPVQRTTRKKVTSELSGNSGQHRWWRVVGSAGKNPDGHPRSWELVHTNNARYKGRPFTSKDVYFTQYRKCEKYSNQNRMFDRDCTRSVVDATNGEQLKHPIAWVNVGFHHIARDEDQTPMPVHWQGFQISPRDVTEMSPLTPDRLHKPRYNGDGEPHEH